MTARRTLAIAAAALLCGVGDVLLVLGSEHFPDPEVWAVFGPAGRVELRGHGPVRVASAARVALRAAHGPGRLRVVPRAALRGRTRRSCSPLGIVASGLWGPIFGHAAAELPDRPAADAGASPARGGELCADPARPGPGAAGQRRRRGHHATAAAGARATSCSSSATRGSATPRSRSARLVSSGSASSPSCMLVRQWRAAAAPERRSLVPLFVSGGVTLALVAAYATSQVDALLWMAFAAFAATPFAFLAGPRARGPLRLARRAHADGRARRHAGARGPARRAGAGARRPGAGARVLDARARPLRRRRTDRRPSCPAPTTPAAP